MSNKEMVRSSLTDAKTNLILTWKHLIAYEQAADFPEVDDPTTGQTIKTQSRATELVREALKEVNVEIDYYEHIEKTNSE